MKNKTKLMIALAIACAGTLTLGACKNEEVYKNLKKEGQNAIVRFDPGDGLLNNEQNLVITNVYSYDKLAQGQMLFEPDSSKKDKTVVVSYNNHFLAGWYRERKPRVNEQGVPLDEFGDLCSVSGKEQGWEYSGRWDFSKKLTQSDFEAQEDGTYLMTLYAGWIPLFTYRILDDNGEEIASNGFNPSIEEGAKDAVLDIPHWDEETGELIYKSFPKADNKTFVSVRETKDSTENLETITHEGTWDIETGTCEHGLKTYYGVYEDGTWFHISKARQIYDNFTSTACFEIVNDLDFSEKDENGYLIATWPAALSSGEFSGKIRGNGHTIRNIEIANSNVNDTCGGLFGHLMGNSEIKDVVFENIVYQLKRGTRMVDASFGLFAGLVDKNAKISNVKITGKFILGNDELDAFASQSMYNYHLGRVTGDLSFTDKIDADIEVEGLGGVTVTVESNGSITATVGN